MSRITAFFIVFLCFSCGNNGVSNSDKKKENPQRMNPSWMKNGTISKEYKNGDIVFIRCESDLSLPISLATNSEYTHCGTYINMKNGPYIMEAYDGVELTPFNEFMENRVGDLLLVMRLKDRDKKFTTLVEADFLTKSMPWIGKNYDGLFMWNDESMYCSELVYKMYINAGIELCKKKKMKDFDFSAPEVQAELKKRYGGEIPLEEPVVAPVDLIYSTLLDTVYYTK